MSERTFGQPEHLRRNANAAFVQRLDRDLVALAHLAQNAVSSNGHVIQNDFAGRRGANAELVFFLADLQAR